MKRNTILTILIVVMLNVLTFTPLFAQPKPPVVPIDGGASILLVIAIVLGIRKSFKASDK
jgi:hypothetical protein